MYSIILLGGTESAIQSVLWTILIIFFVTVMLSWLAASKDWFKEEKSSQEANNVQKTDSE